MNQSTKGGRAGSQSPRRAAQFSVAHTQPASPSPDGPINAATLASLERKRRRTTPLPDRLWNFSQVCAFYGVSERKGAQMRADGVLPDPVVLGPRALRWIPAECMETAGSLPRLDKLLEPVQLASARRARIERMKAGA